jgi:hypothetical protein
MNEVQLSSSIQPSLPVAASESISCWASAKRIEKISGKSFGYIDKFYYLVIDFLACCLGWAKQKQIAEVRGHEAAIAKRVEIDEMICKNFTVLETNVAHISDAEVICLGENHTIGEHRITNTRLIDALCDEPKDLILQEYDESSPPNSLIDYQLTGLKHTKLKIKGWDKRCPELEKESLEAEVNYEVSKSDLDYIKERRKIDLPKIRALLLAGGVFFLSNLAHSAYLAFFNAVFKPAALVCDIAILGMAYFAAKIMERPLKLPYDSNHFAWLKLEGTYKKTDLEFPKRNQHMCQIIDQEAPFARKIFVIAGRSHFSIPERGKYKTPKEWFDTYVVTYTDTMKCLRKKKYAVLKPKNSESPI